MYFRRCILFKAFLRRKKDKKHLQKRGPSLAETRPAGQKGPESVSLVRRATNGKICWNFFMFFNFCRIFHHFSDVPDSVVLPPITVPNGSATLFSSAASVIDTESGGSGSCCAAVGCDDSFDTKTGPIVSVLHFDAYFEEMSANGGAGFRRQFKVKILKAI